MGAGIQSHWSEIVGCYYDDETWEIIPRNYSGRGMRFRRGLSCIMVIAGNEALTTHIQGYPIPMCVINRIACGFHDTWTPSPRSFGHSFHAHLDT